MKLSNLLLSWEVFLGLQQGLTASAGSLPSRKAPSLRVHNGTLSGTFNSHYNQEFFLGVPYAAPPVGDLRLERPAPPKYWRGTKKADSYSAQCLGTSIGLSGFSQTEHVEDMSEDCLYLNVIRPAGIDKGNKLPVLVWIHGGGFFEGSASDGRLNGTFLVHNSVQMGKPLLFVSFNYRLGAFGYLSGKQVQEAGITNLGLHDQRQALVWIQENIHSFGGDPTQVTVMGESAGAASICLHLLSNGGRNDGLYSAVIAQSGNAFTPALTSRTPAQQQADFDGVLEITGCANSTDALSCLRTIPASLLREASKTLVLSLTPDGELVPRSALQALRKGHFVRVPLLMGTTRNEGTSFFQQALKGPLNTNDDLQAFIQSTWAPNKIPDRQLQQLVKSYQREITEPEAGLGTVAAYPNSKLGSQYGSATLWMGDIMFTAGRRFTTQAWASFGVPSYSYFFDTVTANVNATTLGAAHFLEIPYTFGNTRRVGWEKDPFPSDPVLKQKHKVLAKTMSSMWVSFATTHSPNNYHELSPAVHWPVYSKALPRNMVFKVSDGLCLQSDTWRKELFDLIYRLSD